MPATIIGGNARLCRSIRDLCAKYSITVRPIPLKAGGFASHPGNPDDIFVCMDSVSHPLVISAQEEARGHGAPWSSCGAAAQPRWRVNGSA